MNDAVNIGSGAELRKLARAGAYISQTAGQAPDHLQANVVILPAAYAQDFLQYCMNNPKPCPLIGLSRPGETGIASLGTDIDIRKDVPRYRVFNHGSMAQQVEDIAGLWSDDMVTFALGCSFTFEEALIRAGFGVRHIEQGRNVPMFKTSIQTIPGGTFSGPLVVTMRPYSRDQIPAIFDLCAKYPHAHGTPVFWGEPGEIGIDDLGSPDYGDAVDVGCEEVPVFWACGVTPQAAIEAAKPAICITHAPGHMLVTDLRSDVPPEISVGMVDLQIQST